MRHSHTASDSRTFEAFYLDAGNYQFQGLPAGSYMVAPDQVVQQNALGGFYKAGAPGNYTANQSQATLVTIGP
jgi:hypothetical protein